MREPAVRFVQGSFVVPPMPRGGDPRDPGWGLVTAWYAFVHLAQSELTQTVAALARVLRRGGVLALATHVGNEVHHPGGALGRGHRARFRLPRRRCGGRRSGGGRPDRPRVVCTEPAAPGSADPAAVSPGPPTGLIPAADQWSFGRFRILGPCPPAEPPPAARAGWSARCNRRGRMLGRF